MHHTWVFVDQYDSGPSASAISRLKVSTIWPRRSLTCALHRSLLRPI
jgi:hypothetical protein